MTIEYQRQQAKAMRQYFQNLKLAETVERSKCVGMGGGEPSPMQRVCAVLRRHHRPSRQLHCLHLLLLMHASAASLRSAQWLLWQARAIGNAYLPTRCIHDPSAAACVHALLPPGCCLHTTPILGR